MVSHATTAHVDMAIDQYCHPDVCHNQFYRFKLAAALRNGCSEFDFIQLVDELLTECKRENTEARQFEMMKSKQAEEDLRRALRENEELRDRLEIDISYMREQLHPQNIEGILGTSDAMRPRGNAVRRFAR